MESTVETKTVFTLKLDEYEAGWLRGLIQNPLKVDEDKRDAEMRDKIWKALSR